jgi:chemotaxis protein histidine kinase CheA
MRSYFAPVISVITSASLIVSCGQPRYSAAPSPPARSVPHPRSLSVEQEFDDRGRAAWQAGLSSERRQQFTAALAQYAEAVSLFDRALRAADADGIPLVNRPPSIYLNTAKCRIDIARVLIRTGAAEYQVTQHLRTAELVLHKLEEVHAKKADLQGDFWQTWAWRIYYLFGDVHLLQHRLSEARRDYLVASHLNPHFTPPAAIASIIDEAQHARPSGIRESSRLPTESTTEPESRYSQDRPRASVQAKEEAQAARDAEERARTQAEAAQAESAAQERARARAQAKAEAAAAHAAAEERARAQADAQVEAARGAQERARANAEARARAEQVQQQPDGLLQALRKAIPPGRLMELGGAGLMLAAQILEIAELGPWGAGLVLAGMIWQDWDKVKKVLGQTSK